MKKIEAVVRPSKAGDVLEALKKLGNPGVMITEIEGYGKQRGVEQQFRGKTYKTELLPKVRLEIVVSGKDVKKFVDAIQQSAYTGKEGDGKIFISTIDDIMRIRSKESGESAI